MADKEVRAKVTITADPTALVKALKEVQAEAEKLNSTAKKFDVGQAADRVQQGIRERAAVQSELIRRGVIEDPKVAEAARKMRQDAELRRQSSQSLALQGLSLSGMGGAVGGFGHGQAIGGALEGMGFAGLARFAGPVGLAVGTAAMNAEMLKRQERFSPTSVYADPYMDPMTRARGNFSAMPFGETILSYSDTFSGRTAGMQRNEEVAERLRTRLGYAGRSEGILDAIERQMVGGAAERRANERFAIPIPGVFDRSTAVGARQQRESDAVYGSLKQQQLASRELSKATEERVRLENKSAELAERRRQAAIDIKSQEKLTSEFLSLSSKQVAEDLKSASRLGLLSGIVNPTLGVYVGMARAAGIGGSDFSVATNNSRRQLGEYIEREGKIRNDQIGNQQQLEESRRREAQAARAKAQSDIEVKRAELAVNQSREEIAASAAGRLGGLGPAGRAEGLAALSAINDIGIENAPPGLIAAAQSVAPLAIGKKLEAAGIGIAGSEYGRQLEELGAGEDVRDVAGLANLRDRINDQRRRIPAEEQKADERLGSALQAGTDALKGIERLLGEELPRLLESLDNKFRLMRNGQ